MAGLPDAVTLRAKEILSILEDKDCAATKDSLQISLFEVERACPVMTAK